MLLECPNTMAISSSHRRPWERVAQPVEHVTFNHGVLGSSPSALTTQDQALWPDFKSSNLRRPFCTRHAHGRAVMLRALLAAFAGQIAVGAVLFPVIWWRERVKQRRIHRRDDASINTHDSQ